MVAKAARPAIGPSASPIAMARLSCTTGLSVSRSSSSYQPDDLHPVGLHGARRVGVQGGDLDILGHIFFENLLTQHGPSQHIDRLAGLSRS